jgi:hypothetical protein
MNLKLMFQLMKSQNYKKEMIIISFKDVPYENIVRYKKNWWIKYSFCLMKLPKTWYPVTIFLQPDDLVAIIKN